MKLHSLHMTDFLGLALLDATLGRPINLFAGRNASGKSSIKDAVALALTGTLPRIGLKKDAGDLVRTGAPSADCELSTSDGPYSFGIAGGKLSQPKNLRPEFAHVVEAQRFAALPPDERRSFLLGLMKVKMSPADIAAELAALGHATEHVERIAPLLRAGFEGAAQDAKSRATAAKGEWRGITGETYGSEKAKTWAAPVPAHDADKLKQLATEIQHCDVALASWNESKGKIKGAAAHRERLSSGLPKLREQAAMAQRVRDKLTADELEMQRLHPLLEHALASAGTAQRVGNMHDLAAALAPLIKIVEGFELEDAERPVLQHAQLVLANYEALHGRISGSGDPEAAARAKRLRDAVALCESAIANDKRDLTAALEAKTQIIHIEAELGQPFDGGAGLAEADAQIAEITTKRAETVKAADALKGLKKAGDEAEAKTKRAAAAQSQVAALEALGDALLPDGLPAKLLARALGPLNERLDQAAQDTGWAAVVVHNDMRITAGQRDYRLLSESERWRVDAMISEAISYLSGMRVVVLDRFDVLDQHARSELLGWLDALAENDEIDSALVFGTLKEPPKGLPETIGVHWLGATT
jgi:hypothetical protein